MVYFRLLGRLVLRFFLYLGELAGLVGQICESLLQGRKRWRQFFEQIVEIGYRSQIVVVITGGFTGAVLATQALFQYPLVDMETLGGRVRAPGDDILSTPLSARQPNLQEALSGLRRQMWRPASFHTAGGR